MGCFVEFFGWLSFRVGSVGLGGVAFKIKMGAVSMAAEGYCESLRMW